MTGHPGVVYPHIKSIKNRFIPNIDNIVTAPCSSTHSRWRRGLEPCSGGLRELVPEDRDAFHLKVFMSKRGGLVNVHAGGVLVCFVTINNPNRKQMEVVGQKGGENIVQMYEQ